jgi:hypothetical protein
MIDCFSTMTRVQKLASCSSQGVYLWITDLIKSLFLESSGTNIYFEVSGWLSLANENDQSSLGILLCWFVGLSEIGLCSLF